ncbi:GyrI-like domain-containing protein [Okibacterium endophyticum]
MDKYDVKKAHRELYSPPAGRFVTVDVPEFRYLAVDGHGDPNTSSAYAAAIEALYSVSFTLKFESKKTLGRDYAVAPLEGLWHAEDMSVFVTREKSSWDWTMMINQPEWITDDMVASALENVNAKKGIATSRLRMMPLHEGTSVQTLHIGSYDDEAPTLRRLHEEHLPENQLAFNGLHHEIYLSDPRRTAPERLKTVLRQPVRPAL